MFKITIDPSRVKTKESIIPEGQYTVIVQHSEEGEDYQGNNCIKLRLEIASGDYKGMSLWQTLTDCEQTIKHVMDMAKSCGKEQPKEIDAQTFIGWKGVIQTKNRVSDKNGKTYCNFHYWVTNGKQVTTGETEKDASQEIPF